MNTLKDKIITFLFFIGINPYVLRRNLKGQKAYRSDKKKIIKQLQQNSDFKITREYKFLTDRYQQSGKVNGHYFPQDIYVAKRIHDLKPNLHVDIGSRLDGFVSHLAVFRKVEVMDIRPLEVKQSNISFKQADFTKIDQAYYNYTDSLSCLHAIEHFGLGRYGDEVDVDGHIKCLENLYLVLKQRGTLHLSTPIGPQRIEFNAHRVFDLKYLLQLFKSKFEVLRFSYIDDQFKLHENVTLNSEDIEANLGCYFGCAIFELKKV